MRTTPFARVPHAMIQTYRLNELTGPGARAFWPLFVLAARHQEPMIGYLVDQHTNPYSYRDLEAVTGLGRSMLHRAIGSLRKGGHVVEDATGTLFMPSVREIEGRYAKRTAPNDDDDRSRFAQPPLPFAGAVENRGIPAATGPPGVPVLGRNRPGSGTPPPIEVLDEIDVRGVDSRRAGEKPGLTPGSWIDRVPASVSDPDCRYLVAKLAAAEPRWRALLEVDRDRAALERCYLASPAALQLALQQAADDPGAVRRPGAWLTHTVPAIVTAGELAS